MKVSELIGFLEQYDGDCAVKMLQCADDNPLTDDVPIKDALGVESAKFDTYIVLIPE